MAQPQDRSSLVQWAADRTQDRYEFNAGHKHEANLLNLQQTYLVGLVLLTGACCSGTGPSRVTAPTQAPQPTSAASAATAATQAPCTRATSLKDAASCTGRLIGTALTTTHLDDNGYINAAREFNYVTAENEMKWDTIEPLRGSFNFARGDQIVYFAEQNGMQVKGHTLVWHNQLPKWIRNLDSAAEVRAAMLDHIHAEMDHWKGKVLAWDVVNEAWTTDKNAGNGNPVFRDSVFYRSLGPSFIDEAFTAARQADPKAKLYYNDYSAEGMNDKSDAIYKMLKGMVDRRIPIDGVGLQMHIGTPNDTPTAADIAQNMQRLAQLGLEIVISEIDVNSCDGYDAQQQATLDHDVVAACVAQPACKAITFWGITDKYSWLNRFKEAGCTSRTPNPLLWDNDYGKKPAYHGVMNALLGR